MADAAYAGTARAGYTRASVYLPYFENNILPALKKADLGAVTGIFDPTAIFDPVIFDTVSTSTAIFEELKKQLEI